MRVIFRKTCKCFLIFTSMCNRLNVIYSIFIICKKHLKSCCFSSQQSEKAVNLCFLSAKTCCGHVLLPRDQLAVWKQHKVRHQSLHLSLWSSKLSSAHISVTLSQAWSRQSARKAKRFRQSTSLLCQPVRRSFKSNEITHGAFPSS